MRVLRLSTFLDYGGIESKMVKLSKVKQDRFDFYFCSIGKGGAAESEIIAIGGKTVCLNESYKIGSIRTFLKVADLIKNIKPDVVHCSGAEAVFYGVLAGRLLKIKIVVAEEIGIPKPSRITARVFKFVYSLAHKAVGESTLVCNELSRVYSVNPDKISVIHNFIDCNTNDTSRDAHSGFVKLLSVCRLEPVKNIEGVLKALSILRDQGYRFVYHILGDGSDSERLKEVVRDLALSEKVIFHGYVEDTSKHYLDADLFLMNSYSEGFSNSLLEAMNHNIPVISTKVGGAVDVIENEVNGWLVNTDDVPMLIDTLKGFYSLSVPERLMIGKNGGDHVRSSFSSESHMAALSSLYAV